MEGTVPPTLLRREEERRPRRFRLRDKDEIFIFFLRRCFLSIYPYPISMFSSYRSLCIVRADCRRSRLLRHVVKEYQTNHSLSSTAVFSSTPEDWIGFIEPSDYHGNGNCFQEKRIVPLLRPNSLIVFDDVIYDHHNLSEPCMQRLLAEAESLNIFLVFTIQYPIPPVYEKCSAVVFFSQPSLAASLWFDPDMQELIKQHPQEQKDSIYVIRNAQPPHLECVFFERAE